MSEKFSLLIEDHDDYHNNFGLFFTPNINIRYSPEQSTVLRIPVGIGQEQQVFLHKMLVYLPASERSNRQTNNPHRLAKCLIPDEPRRFSYCRQVFLSPGNF
ncbi:MAG: hypothetical protein IPL55_00985 [Saprospiraceae bacterium]|nr:hypothetical protein [Saprospiraceae bacterium]MBL0025642.1 hypothetical protein [Saprospiraceae bacterium]